MTTKQTYDFDKNCHSVYVLQYHLIIVVKYRQKAFISDKIIDRLKQTIKQQAEFFDCQIINQECDIDHIHIILKAKPQTELTKLVNSIKGVSSRLLRKEFHNELQDILWGGEFLE